MVVLEPGETKGMHYLDPSKEQELSIEVTTTCTGYIHLAVTGRKRTLLIHISRILY